jgi:hypothetical protein
MENSQYFCKPPLNHKALLLFKLRDCFFTMSCILLSASVIFILTALHSNKAYSANTDNNSFNSQREVPNPLYGITIDAIDPLTKIIESISSLPKRMTTRIVFDEWVPAAEYTEALEALHPKSYIMGEILDSYYVKDYSIKQYSERVKEYLDAHGDKVDIWEIGNEVNGEWLGNPEHVATKIEDAYQQVKARDYKSALTLYYNKDCWAHSWEEMFQWAETRLSNNLRTGLDYVLVSYYEEDCNNLKPNWQNVFTKLGELFPHAKLAFGEVGTSKSRNKTEYLKRYYTMKINHPRYVGGHFWWYFIQDMVPKTKPLWSTLNDVLKLVDKQACDAEVYRLSNNIWKLISLPCQPPNNTSTVTSVFGKNIIGGYGTDWYVYRYDIGLSKYVALKADDSVSQGIGYWIIQATGETILLNMPTDSTATPVTKSASCSNPKGCFAIPLVSQTNATQWNLLGNPLAGRNSLNTMRVISSDLSTDNICTHINSCTLEEAETNGLVGSSLWHYVDNNVGYEELKTGDSTSPWDGFWSIALGKADRNHPSLLIPIQ